MAPAIDYQGLVTQGLAKQISEKIREAIVQGRLRMHERLPTEAELAARFRVSRPTIREALKRLAAQNLIRSRRGPTGGTFVNKPSREEWHSTLANAASLLVSTGELEWPDLVEARQEIEAVCCRLGAARRTDAQLQALAHEVQTQRDPDLTDVDFCASDVRFHRMLIECAANPSLEFAAAGIIEALQPAINLIVFRVRDRGLVADQHERIRAALAARDGAAACAALTAYLNALRGQYAAAHGARGRGAGQPAKKPRRA